MVRSVIMADGADFPCVFAEIEHACGCRFVSRDFMTQSHTATLYCLRAEDNRSFILKHSPADPENLECEGWMLAYLARNTDLPVPGVYYNHSGALVMDHVPGRTGADRTDIQKQAACHLANLHKRSAPLYGLARDTIIGPLRQPNIQDQHWTTFFRDQRLLYMAEMALDEKAISQDCHRDLQRLADRLEDFLDEPERPSLVHGDMWQGNILSAGGKLTAFIDPAIYYADPETELAFSTLFQTFGEAFFDEYQRHRPIRPGFFEYRRDLYNLYPLLVHARLFSGGYARQVHVICRSLLCL